MSTPRYAGLASKALVEGEPAPAPPPRPDDRARAIGAVQQAILQRRATRRRTRWLSFVAAAAMVAATVAGAGHVARRHAAATMPAVPAEMRVVGYASAGAASVLVLGEASPLVEGRALGSGSRVVAAKGGRVLLAFATGTSAVLDDAGCRRTV